MRPRVLVIGVPLVLVAAVLLALAAETQAVAHALKYARGLGEPLGRVAAIPLYAPWAIISWRGRFAALAPHAFQLGEGVRWLSGVLVVVFGAGVLMRWRGRGGYDDAHGTARWATTKELERRGLLQDSGLVLCQTDDAVVEPLPGGGFRQRRPGRLVRDSSGLHALIYAPSGSGKGVAICVPSLLSWTESVVVWDTKRELWQLSAGWRSQFSRCVRFEPTSRSSDRYNPLAEIRKGTDAEVRDTQAIAEMLADPDGKGDEAGGSGNERHFRLSAQKLLEALILHVLYVGEDRSLPGVARFAAAPDRDHKELLEIMAATKHLGDRPHPAVADGALAMSKRSDTELAGIFSTVSVALGLYGSDPVLARAVSGSDFRIRDLMHGPAPTSLYLVSPPSDLTRLRPVMRLLLNQVVRRLTEENVSGGGKALKHRLLFLLDEFPTLGKMAVFAEGISYFRGYGIKLVLIAQSVKQLAERYGEKNSIVDNCDVRLTYHANDPETAKYVSEALGTSTYQKTAQSVSAEAGSFFGKRQTSTSTQEHARPLLTPDEVARLPREQAILFGGGAAPYRAKKVIYYDDPRFKERAAMPPPSVAEDVSAARRGGGR